MSKKILLSLFGIYLFSSLVSYFSFSVMGKTVVNVADEAKTANQQQAEDVADDLALLPITASMARNQACPLNGKLFTDLEKQAWSKRRPLAVMIENSPSARPQSGLNDADVVFEAVAEYGVTRFMGIFYCGAQHYDTVVAPVRSARTYFVDWASGFNRPMYVHVGGANLPGPTDALGQLSSYGWNMENAINQFSVGFPTFVRNFNRVPGKKIATEHTMETTTEKLWAVAEKRGWTNMSPELKTARGVIEPSDWADGYKGWSFEDPQQDVEKGDATDVSYGFWSGFNDFAVRWKYDASQNGYLREMAGTAHVDMNSDEQLLFSNVVVLQTTERGPVNELKHMIYTTTGTGKAVVFKNGQAERVNWKKLDRESELEFTDLKGAPFKFAPGKIWISVVDVKNEPKF